MNIKHLPESVLVPFFRDISEEHRRLSLEEETIWLRIRSLTLRLISGLPSLSHAFQPKNSEKTAENGVSSKIDTIRALLQQLEVAMDSGKRFLEQTIQVSVKKHYPRILNERGCKQRNWMHLVTSSRLQSTVNWSWVYSCEICLRCAKDWHCYPIKEKLQHLYLFLCFLPSILSLALLLPGWLASSAMAAVSARLACFILLVIFMN